jgi:hypothetical protein
MGLYGLKSRPEVMPSYLYWHATLANFLIPKATMLTLSEWDLVDQLLSCFQRIMQPSIFNTMSARTCLQQLLLCVLQIKQCRAFIRSRRPAKFDPYSTYLFLCPLSEDCTYNVPYQSKLLDAVTSVPYSRKCLGYTIGRGLDAVLPFTCYSYWFSYLESVETGV